MHIFLTLLSAVASVSTSSQMTFEAFETKYNKHYASKAERRYRKRIFEENLVKIDAHNRRQTSYILDINDTADMTQHEFSFKRLGMSAKDQILKMKSSPYYLGTHQKSLQELPKAVDWTEKGAVTPVKNQGHCGSCYAFSATGALEGGYFLSTGKLVSLSEQQIVDCGSETGNNGCNGGLMDYSFDYVMEHGICEEKSYPYKADEETCDIQKCTPVIKPGELDGFYDVHPRDSSALMDASAQITVSVAIQADEVAFQFYKSGVLTGTCGSDLNHGVLLVGYGVTESNQMYWKVKNSWGTAWGDQGYILLERIDHEKDDGKCGILLAASYPVFKSAQVISASDSNPLGDPYGKADKTCVDPDIPVELGQFPGYSYCAPPCDEQSKCLAAPKGSSAKGQCIIENGATGETYCGLICKVNSKNGCPENEECLKVQGSVGICMFKNDQAYHSSKRRESLFDFKFAYEQTNVVIASA
jgi:C1A family cysteine protease